MGSYGDRWLRCSWCEKWGKCTDVLAEDVTPLWDIDGIGVLCEPCDDRWCPPHYDYLSKMLGPRLSDNPSLIDAIAQFAYPICAEIPFRLP